MTAYGYMHKHNTSLRPDTDIHQKTQLAYEATGIKPPVPGDLQPVVRAEKSATQRVACRLVLIRQIPSRSKLASQQGKGGFTKKLFRRSAP